MRTLRILMSVMIVMIIMTACGGSDGELVEEAYMATGQDGRQATTSYSDDATFYGVVKLSDEAQGKTLRVVWQRADDSEESFSDLNVQKETIAEDTHLSFKLGGRGLWAAGAYQMAIYIDDKQASAIPFNVTPGATPTLASAQATPSPTPTAQPTSATMEEAGDAEVRADDTDVEEVPVADWYDYTHSTQAFHTLQHPHWKVVDEDEHSVLFGNGQAAESFYGILFYNTQADYKAETMDKLADEYVSQVAGQYGTDYKELETENRATRVKGDPARIIPITYTAFNGQEGTMDFIFQQIDEIVFVRYFISPSDQYDQLRGIWKTFRINTRFDAVAASEAVAELDFAAIWPKPTATPAQCSYVTEFTKRCVNLSGTQGAFVIYNHTNLDIEYGGDIGDGYHVPPGGELVIPLAPGRYQYHFTGLGYGAGESQIDIAPGQIIIARPGYDVNKR